MGIHKNVLKNINYSYCSFLFLRYKDNGYSYIHSYNNVYYIFIYNLAL